VCITTNHPDSNPNPNPTTKRHAVVSIQQARPTYPEKSVWDDVIAHVLLRSVVIVTLRCGRGKVVKRRWWSSVVLLKHAWRLAFYIAEWRTSERDPEGSAILSRCNAAAYDAARWPLHGRGLRSTVRPWHSLLLQTRLDSSLVALVQTQTTLVFVLRGASIFLQCCILVSCCPHLLLQHKRTQDFTMDGVHVARGRARESGGLPPEAEAKC